MSGPSRRPVFAVVCALQLAAAQPAAAQQTRPSVLAIDTIASIDGSSDFNGNNQRGVVLDAVVSVGFGRGFEAIVWPIALRLPSGEWMRDVWIAEVRYQRPGRVRLRIDGGLIPSPVGLANLMRRPHLIPVISQPASLFTPLPPLDAPAPRTNLLGAVYPFGGQVTVSGATWDARAAVIDSSPLRRRLVFAEVNPPRFANVVVGGGVTPFVGFRVGASVTRGGWQRAGENAFVTSSRSATVVTVESDLSFRYTKLLGEWVRDIVETSRGDAVPSGWFVLGQQTLAPRWFVAGRLDRMSAPAVLPALVQQQRLLALEEVLGVRLSPEITLRIGHRARRGFGRSGFDHQAAVSVVWWKRWM